MIDIHSSLNDLTRCVMAAGCHARRSGAVDLKRSVARAAAWLAGHDAEALRQLVRNGGCPEAPDLVAAWIAAGGNWGDLVAAVNTAADSGATMCGGRR